MKQTMAELFSSEEQYAYVILVWGSRAEAPHEVASRAWETAKVLREAVPADDARYPNPLWVEMNPSWEADGDDAFLIEAPDSLTSLETRIAGKGDVDDHGTLTDGIPVGAYLSAEGLNGSTVASYSGKVGDGRSYIGNTVTVRFQPDFPIGQPDDAAALFRSLVSIWQPDWASLDTLRTSREIEGLEKTYADYLTWLSRPAFGIPPELASATTARFGDGTLLTVKEWSIDGVRAMYKELVAAGIPAAKVQRPLDPQVVPAFHGK